MVENTSTEKILGEQYLSIRQSLRKQLLQSDAEKAKLLVVLWKTLALSITISSQFHSKTNFCAMISVGVNGSEEFQ